MAIKDAVTIKYIRQNEIFADAFNYFIYGGKQMIDPDSLEELDTREIDVPYGGIEGAEQPVQRTRDVIKSVTAMTDHRTAFLVLAIESQSNVHYAMPVKNMVYDALQYAKQVEKAMASHRKSGDYRGSSGDEYLSGFMKQDRLMPVVTLVMYFDAKTWDGPMSIHDMFENQDRRILSFVPDYKINLIIPGAIPDEDFGKFNTTLKEVLAFIKYSKDADKLGQIVNADPKFHELGRKEVDVLNNCVNAKLEIKEEEEVIDVCEAIQIIADRAAKKAAEQAIEETTERVTKQVTKQVTEQVRIKILVDNLRKIMEKMNLTAEQAMDFLEVSKEDQDIIHELLQDSRDLSPKGCEKV